MALNRRQHESELFYHKFHNFVIKFANLSVLPNTFRRISESFLFLSTKQSEFGCGRRVTKFVLINYTFRLVTSFKNTLSFKHLSSKLNDHQICFQLCVQDFKRKKGLQLSFRRHAHSRLLRDNFSNKSNHLYHSNSWGLSIGTFLRQAARFQRKPKSNFVKTPFVSPTVHEPVYLHYEVKQKSFEIFL